MFLYFYIQKSYVLTLCNWNKVFFLDSFSLQSNVNCATLTSFMPFQQQTQTWVLECSRFSSKWYKSSCFLFLSGWKMFGCRSVHFLEALLNSGNSYSWRSSPNLTKMRPNSWQLIKSDLNPSRPNPGRREKIKLKFLFSHFFVVPFEAPQRSVKIKILA